MKQKVQANRNPQWSNSYTFFVCNLYGTILHQQGRAHSTLQDHVKHMYCTCTRMHARAHTRACTHAHTHAHTHTRTQTHTHTQHTHTSNKSTVSQFKIHRFTKTQNVHFIDMFDSRLGALCSVNYNTQSYQIM